LTGSTVWRKTLRRMRILLNGEARDVPAGLSVLALLEHLEFVDGPVAVERNREVVPRAEHPQVYLQEGDVLEIVHFVGGG